MKGAGKMKKILGIVLALAVFTGLCPAAAEVPKTELIVFAAASLTESLTEIKAHTGAETLTFIPYFAWDNRAAGKMKVWIPLNEE